MALKRLLAMRAYKRGQNVEGVEDVAVLDDVGLSTAQAEEMYRYLAIANYEDRFVIPTEAEPSGGIWRQKESTITRGPDVSAALDMTFSTAPQSRILETSLALRA